MCMHVGTVIEGKGITPLIHVGEFEAHGRTFGIARSPNYEPIVNHPDGRKFILSWKDIANIALDAFDENTEIEKVDTDENS